MINEQWENNEATTTMWRLIRNQKYDEVKNFLNDQPQLAHIRSQDGRGPMWWAYESNDKRMIKLLQSFKVSETRTDSFGILPKDVNKPVK
jgi:dolichyl-diphosphooligosaccharide---protein glycosyltransferase